MVFSFADGLFIGLVLALIFAILKLVHYFQLRSQAEDDSSQDNG